MTILVGGGAGYIGSHTCVELLNKGYNIIIADNLSNSHIQVIDRLERITGKRVEFAYADLCDLEQVKTLFEKYGKIDCVMQFAGLKSVGESVANPLRYYENNLLSTINLLHVMKINQINNFIFSSSATVYGENGAVPYVETSQTGHATNPYGYTKVVNEQILRDYYQAVPSSNIVLLRYFNPIGAHESGLIGEDPCGIPNNLLPYIARVAVGQYELVKIYGNDYPTQDGTGVRDYIHVVDLAKGHVAAIDMLQSRTGFFVYNLGTGHGSSVLEVLHTYEKVCGKKIPYQFNPRRPGDVAISYADVSLAQKELGWSAQYTLEDMCRTSWKWQSMNPNGYCTTIEN